jgi:hypothetical protein
MEDMNFSQQETLQKDYDQFFEFVEDSLPTIDIWSNQNYELKAKTLREKNYLTISDYLWLDNEYLARKGIWIFKNKDSIEVTKSDRTPLASFEFSPEDFGSSYIKVVKLCLDFYASHQG